VRGSLTVNDHPLQGGDALKIEGESALTIEGGVGAELLLFDLQ
jgi:redox-sensitive bicupin YhaK (pirin superfamily)